MLATERWQIKTLRVLEMVYDERLAQVARYGHNEDVEDGTGPRAKWLQPVSDLTAKQAQKEFRKDYLAREAKHGLPTWLQLVREELAEAAECDDDEALVHELTQVAALCISWIEKKVD